MRELTRDRSPAECRRAGKDGYAYGPLPYTTRKNTTLWSHLNLPWTTLQVQDWEGEWRNLWVTVDTGDNGDLSLPARCLNRLGLTLPYESEIETVHDLETVKVGDAKVKWQGEERLVECRQRKNKPPLVGMKLLQGHRLTMDFFHPGSPVEIGRIPRTARSDKGLVASMVDHLRF